MIYSWVKNDGGILTWNSKGAEAKPRFMIVDGSVIKLHPNKLNEIWHSKMEKVLEVWHPLGFEFITNGYKLPFINGFDLHGNQVFSYDNELEDCNYDIKYLPSIKKIFDTIDLINNKIGITFADTSPSNIVVDPGSVTAHLIDFDDIIPLDEAQLAVFNANKDKIFNKNRWNG